MSELYIDVESRIAERVADLRRRFDDLAPVVAEAVGEAVKQRAQGVAAARIDHPSVFGGYLDGFDVETELRGSLADFILTNRAPHAEYVELGRLPGRAVQKTYVDNAENRRRGRVGGTYVSHYTGMPPSGIFGDGFAGRGIFRYLRSLSAAEFAELVRLRLPLLLEG